MKEPLVKVLITAIGFMMAAFAGVMWTSYEKMHDTMLRVEARLTAIEHEQVFQRDHREQPWHDQAGNKIHEFDARLRNLEGRRIP